MFLEIYGINYHLHLTANLADSRMDVTIVDEAFCEAPLIAKSGTASKIAEIAERYSGMKISDHQKLEISEYFGRMQDAGTEIFWKLNMEHHLTSPRDMAESVV